MTSKENKKILTSENDVEKFLTHLSDGIQKILDQNLIGLYLFGSLSYGDFNPDSSDIDLVAILDKPISHLQLDQIKLMHSEAKILHEKWGSRLECSYTPIDLFKYTLPPKEPRPYYGNGIFYEEAPYGNEWIINNYLLYQHGVSLIGPDFRDMFEPISIIEVQKASIRDLFQEWEPKITDYEWLDNSHYQSYLVMNLCRILYTVMRGSAGTKRTAATWVRNEFKSAWISNLIEAAESWNYSKKLLLRDKTIDFIKFTVDEIKKTKLYQEVYFSN
jgi:predicted nucleotidyltransferase